MSQKNIFFSSGFDDSTMTKLFIFEKYVENWLPVFLKQQKDYIYIFDFFAGAGYDSKNNPGSPIRILKQIVNYHSNISDNTKINLFFNERDKKYFKNLQSNCDDYIKRYPFIDNIVNIKYYNEDFKNIFNSLKNTIGKYPSLVFMDQFGVKYSNYISEFEKFDTTDFLFFISSSYLKRFAETTEFKNTLELTEEDIEKFKNSPYKLIHEATIQFLKGKLLPNSSLKLYSFSLKKGSNIYGLIFGAKHPLAVDKFLHIVWKINTTNGSANYDIYDDEEKKQPNLFPELVGKTTIQLFQEEFKEKVLEVERIQTNKDAYYYTIEKGNIPKHATEVLRSLKKEGIINYTGSPLVNYENVVKNRRIIKYEKNKD
jgi:three-Cys-motif partner protein